VADSKWLDRPEKLVNKHLILERCPLGELTMSVMAILANNRVVSVLPTLSPLLHCPGGLP